MKINYRPEIDGLRAISVFAVIFYHANFIIYDNLFFQGGFLGVDIFFVISGYLITSLILKEIKVTGKFYFINFFLNSKKLQINYVFNKCYSSIIFLLSA